MNEAELLLTEILGCSRTDLYLKKRHQLGVDAGSRMACVLQRRIKGEPFQYIVGNTEFMGLSFEVGPYVLIPRPETELVVERIRCLYRGNPQKRILDIGTGSGCIAISLAKLIPGVAVTATDISTHALMVARKNAACHNVAIDFFCADLFPAQSEELFHCIVSNPPYIPTQEIDTLQPEVRREPRNALDGGRDGLDFYRRIITRAPAYLVNGGHLVMEIGFAQGIAIRELFGETKRFEIIDVVKDYADIERIVVARLI